MPDPSQTQLEHGLASLEAQARQMDDREVLVALCASLGDWAVAAAPLLGRHAGLAQAEAKRLL